MEAQTNSPAALKPQDLYVLCRVMLLQQFDTGLNCFIIKKKSFLLV